MAVADDGADRCEPWSTIARRRTPRRALARFLATATSPASWSCSEMVVRAGQPAPRLRDRLEGADANGRPPGHGRDGAPAHRAGVTAAPAPPWSTSRCPGATDVGTPRPARAGATCAGAGGRGAWQPSPQPRAAGPLCRRYGRGDRCGGLSRSPGANHNAAASPSTTTTARSAQHRHTGAADIDRAAAEQHAPPAGLAADTSRPPAGPVPPGSPRHAIAPEIWWLPGAAPCSSPPARRSCARRRRSELRRDAGAPYTHVS